MLKRLHTLAALSGLSLAAAAASADTGGQNPADKAAPHPDDAKAAADAKKTADANVAAADANGDGKLKYRVRAEFHDTTTGRTRKKGRALTATAERAAVLLAAGVIDPDPLHEDDPDQLEDDPDTQNADPGVNTVQVAPATVGGVVDQAVIVAAGEGAAVTDGQREGTLPAALTTDDVPAIVTGKGRSAK